MFARLLMATLAMSLVSVSARIFAPGIVPITLSIVQCMTVTCLVYGSGVMMSWVLYPNRNKGSNK